MNISQLVRPAIKTFPPISWGESQYDDSYIVLKWGENPYGLPYPSLMTALKLRLAKYTGCNINQICLTNGSDKAFRLLAEVFIESGDKAITFTPSYPVIDSSVAMMGGKIIKIPLSKNFTIPPLSQIKECINSKTKLIYICNPNNPTGNFMATNPQIEALLQLPIIAVVDEAYFEFSNRSSFNLLKQYNNLIILRSFSKTFGLAGLRVGYSISSPKVNNYLLCVEESIEIFNISTPSLTGTISALDNLASLKKNIAKINSTREKLAISLKKLAIIPYPSFASFMMFNLKNTGTTAKKFVSRMQTQKIILKDVSIYSGLTKYDVYMAIPAESQLTKVITAIKKSLC